MDSAKHVDVLIVGAGISGIAAAYYLKIVAAMYLREPLYPFSIRDLLPVKVTAILCTVAVLVFFFVPSVLLSANNTATDTSSTTRPAAVERVPASPAPAAAALR